MAPASKLSLASGFNLGRNSPKVNVTVLSLKLKYMRVILFTLLIYCLGVHPTHARQPVLLLTDDSSDRENLNVNTPVSVGTDTVRLVLRTLTQYDIEIQHTPNARLNKILENSPATCAYNRIKTPRRSQKNLFSKPVNVYLSHRLYYLSAKGPLPDTLLVDGAVSSLHNLFLHYPNQKLALGKGRSYGKLLDQQIAGLKPRNKIVLTGQNIFYDLQKMLSKERADFVIAYPDTISSVLVPDALPISSYPIAGTDSFILGHFACFPDLTGINFIYDVDKSLRQLFNSGKLLDAHLQHYHPGDHNLLREYFDNVLTTHYSSPAKRSVIPSQ